MTMTLPRILLTAFALAAAPGCIIVTSGADDPGDIEFLWRFDGEERCQNAGVGDVDVSVADASGAEVFGDVYTCTGGGLTIRDFAPGRHSVTLRAYGFENELLYEGVRSVTVESNVIVDMGYIELDRVVPEVANGDVTFSWAFYYPSDQLESRCGRAGVDEVDVRIAPKTGTTAEEFSQTYECSAGGINVVLPEGEYVLTVDAYAVGATMADDLRLYGSEEIDLVVLASSPLNLGDVEMFRVGSSFGDVDVAWSTTDSCANLGVDDIDFVITRVDDNSEEYSFTVPCAQPTSELIRIFVPGGYSIEAAADGLGGESYYGVETFTVQPNQVSEITVDLIEVAP
jgi:hypothetical protein